jgi:hypothetical protein
MRVAERESVFVYERGREVVFVRERERVVRVRVR